MAERNQINKSQRVKTLVQLWLANLKGDMRGINKIIESKTISSDILCAECSMVSHLLNNLANIQAHSILHDENSFLEFNYI